MCGIAGFISSWRQTEQELGANVHRMIGELVHRGPDDRGIWVDPNHSVALGHQRLSIIDLSVAGQQPMLSADGRWVLTYNGEIYNFRELKKSLQKTAYPFKGHSDTEVLLAGIATWGLEKTLEQINGMFAFALWDRKEGVLTLCRDRMGIKPLYWRCGDGEILFGSELKAMRVYPYWQARLDRQSAADFLRYSYIPSPKTIYEKTYQCRPGHFIQFVGDRVIEHVYWDSAQIVDHGIKQRESYERSDQEALDELQSLLRMAVKRRMVADVPLGAFLSGGIDSSLVVALMQEQSNRPINTFSIGFTEEAYNEADHAKRVAEHLWTDHHELIVTPREAQEVIYRLPKLYDEPFADISQIPTLLVSQLARQQVKVVLSGDGGDELWAGYNRYLLVHRLWGRISRLPGTVRGVMGRLILGLSPNTWDTWIKIIPKKMRPACIGDRLHKLAKVLKMTNPEDLYDLLVSHEVPDSWQARHQSSGLVLGLGGPCLDDLSTASPDLLKEEAKLVDRFQCWDMLHYLPDDILTKVDRATMAVGLEGRTPLLDHELVHYVWGLPLSMKLRGGQSKWLLRQCLYRYVPSGLIDRPKMGFGVPMGEWLRGDLREWAEDQLNLGALRQQELLDARLVESLWQEHLSRRTNMSSLLWNILMLQSWQASWLPASG